MRVRVVCLVSVAALAGGVLDAPAAEEQGVARPGGAFAVLNVSDSTACMRSCAADGLCMAWTYLPSGACELKAIVPAPIAQPDAVSGLSARAPASLPTAALPDTRTPPPAAPRLAMPAPALALNEPVLLGGPDATENALRPRLGGSR